MGRDLEGPCRRVADRGCDRGPGFRNRSGRAVPRTSPAGVGDLGGPLIGPIVAVVSFVCYIGNVPLAVVLWSGGISFGGVIAFIFADLVILPILNISRKYYVLKMTAGHYHLAQYRLPRARRDSGVAILTNRRRRDAGNDGRRTARRSRRPRVAGPRPPFDRTPRARRGRTRSARAVTTTDPRTRRKTCRIASARPEPCPRHRDWAPRARPCAVRPSA